MLFDYRRVLAVCIIVASFAAPAAAAGGTPTGADSGAIARGAYVAIEADCMSCHTAPGGKPYAGGNALKSPYGIIYGPNITPDPATGIGKWTKAEFENALRQGVSRDGSFLYPAMPFENYTQMTAADLDALWVFLRTVKPVVNVPPKNTLPFPLNVRSGLAVWRSAYFKPGSFVPDQHKDAEWNRGAYLVQVMGHCGQCHTPRNFAQALEAEHSLAGAKIEGWYAPDISNDAKSSLNAWDVREVAQFLKTGVMPGNSTAIGPMREAVHDSLSRLRDADLEAIAVYLKAQPPVQPVAIDKSTWSADRREAGKLVYEEHCRSCHQENGKGIPGSVPALAMDGAVTAGEPYNVIMALLEGFAPHASWGAMASFADVLSDAQIADVANYVRTSWGNDAAPNATPWSVATWRNTAGAPQNTSHELLCPNLSGDVVQPALQEGPDALRKAALDGPTLTKVIDDYRSARPRTSKAQVVEALSTAYCRTVAADDLTSARMSAQIASFAQRVAAALSGAKTSS